jgi:hypothetical protein
MPAARTQGIGKFGITSAESGFIVESIDFDYSAQKVELEDHTGSTVDVAFFNDMVKINLDCTVPATSAFAGSIGDSITLSNTIPDHIANGGGVSAGFTVIDTIKVSKKNKEFNKTSLGISLHPMVVEA